MTKERGKAKLKKGKDGIYNKYIKRLLDIIISFSAIIILSPLMLFLTIVGVIAMKGNPFFVQERPGRIDPKTGREKIFKLIKFRTMSNAKDSSGNLLPDKERLNKYGKFLRKTSLDELGELFNIFVGDMAIVGPRPLLVEYLPYYSDEEKQRHLVRPGLTGYAQVSGRNALTWSERFSRDIEYVENVSLKFDVNIIFLTVKKIVIHEGIEFQSNGTIYDYFNSESIIVENIGEV